MGFQYDHRERQSGISKKYTEVIENETDANKRMAIQNEILGIQNKSVIPSQNPLLLTPNKKFIEEYEKRTILQRKADERSLFKENFNEKGEKYSMIWNNEDFRKVHDPIGNII